jgi:hypothetical protein
MDEMLGELSEDLRLGLSGCPLDLRMTGVVAPDAGGEVRDLSKQASAIDAERPWAEPLSDKFFWAPTGRRRGLRRAGTGEGDAGNTDDDKDRGTGVGMSSFWMPLANDDVNCDRDPSGSIAARRVGSSPATGSGESSGNGTVSNAVSSLYTEVSIDRPLGAVLAEGHESAVEAWWGPFSPEGLSLGLALLLSDESSSPTLNLGRPRDVRGIVGGPNAAIERGVDASEVVVLAGSVTTGAGLGLARRGRPRSGLWAPGPRSVEKLSMLADWVRVCRLLWCVDTEAEWSLANSHCGLV